ncbi:MAG: hypothetical protein Ta2A_11390 [Treponemataceae bacterium]|nr:MAG: hypothetical protein Ta2A_11390 [Treponemataceae bacterium]
MNYPVDSYDAWKNWKYADLLNPYEEGVVWVLDPRWITMEFKRRMQQWAFRRFHQHPLTSAALVAWFFIKQFELDCIRTAVEGMRLNVDKDIVRTFAGK